MKKFILVLVAVVLVALVVTRGQNPALTPSTLAIGATVSHTNCQVTTGQTVYCFAGDGLWISLNGAAFAQVQTGTTVAGVTSFNGRTGAVVPTSGDYSYQMLSPGATLTITGTAK